MEMADRSDSKDVKLEERLKATEQEEKEIEKLEEEEAMVKDDPKSNCQLLPDSSPETMPMPALNATVCAAGSQLTIFYSGSVMVFDGIPQEKISEIIRIAATAAAAAAIKSGEEKNIETGSASSSPLHTRSPVLQNTAAAVGSLLAQLSPAQKNSLCKLQAEFPIARRHSLQRFLEKRKDRLVSKNPYPSSPAMKAENDTKG